MALLADGSDRFPFGMRRRCALGLLAIAAATVAGCGSEDFPNDPRPASPVELSARVDDSKVVIAPDKVGAGLATVTISNQSREDVEVGFSGPTNPRSTEIAAGNVGTVKLDLEQGDYQVDAGVSSIAPGTLTVGEPRETAQNKLLLP
jgi:hypothetical protein